MNNVELEQINKVHSYASEYIDKIDVAIYLEKLEETHGTSDRLINFISCWEQYLIMFPEENENIKRIIKATVCHDLGICDDKSATPRSGSYSDLYVRKFLKKMQDIKNEQDMVKKAPLDNLPLLISSLKYERSKKLLEERLKNVQTSPTPFRK